MKKNGNDSGQKATAEDIAKYQKAWVEKMIEIWQDNIRTLHVYDKWKLFNEMKGDVIDPGAAMTTLQHQFLMYGFYQDVGTGRGFVKNDGHLDILDPAYREAHRLDIPRKVGPAWGGGYTSGEPRKPREWFSRSYFISVRVLKEAMASLTAEEFAGMLVDAISKGKTGTTSFRSRLWG